MDIWFTLFVTLVALLAAAGVSLLLMAYLLSLVASLAYGWRWALVVFFLPVVGAMFFCFHHRENLLRTGRQLVAGVALVATALALLYGGGSAMVRRVANLQHTQQAVPANPSADVPARTQAEKPSSGPSGTRP